MTYLTSRKLHREAGEEITVSSSPLPHIASEKRAAERTQILKAI